MSHKSNLLIERWRCPKSHSPLVLLDNFLICTDETCRLRFQIQDGIPVMLVEKAMELDHDDWQAAIAAVGG